MKKTKSLSILAAVVLGICACFTAVACEKADGDHTHEYKWTVTSAPTEDKPGTITGTCEEDGETQVVDVPALSDNEFWTSKTTPPTHTEDGYVTYTSSEYGVEVKIPGEKSSGHEWGEYVVLKKPTQEETGTATRYCKANDNGTDEAVMLSVLGDTEFWSVDTAASKAPTHEEPGYKVYYNETYDITVREELEAEGHNWTDWAVKEGFEPDETIGGKIFRTCKDGDSDEQTVDVPSLSTSSFWTRGAKSDADCENAGYQVYTNAEFDLTYNHTVEALGHDWSDWEWVDGVQPDKYTGASITRHCLRDGDTEKTETHEVPMLTLSATWTKTLQSADYNTAGYEVYTANFDFMDEPLVVKLKTSDKLVAPYDNKTYVSFSFQTGEVNQSVGKYNHWTYKTDPDDYNIHVGLSAVYLFAPETDGESAAECDSGSAWTISQGHFTLELIDEAKGKVKFICEKNGETTIYYGYVEMTTGVMVVRGLHDMIVFVPVDLTEFESVEAMNTVDAIESYSSLWEGGQAISLKVNAESNTVNIFVGEDDTYFNVSFKDAPVSGGDVAAVDCYDADYVGVFDKDGVKIIGFAKNTNEVLQKTDDLEGTYVGTVDLFDYESQQTLKDQSFTVKLNGVGYGAILSSPENAYNVYGVRYVKAAADSDYTLDLYVTNNGNDIVYYEVTLGDSLTFTSVLPLVMITKVYNHASYEEEEKLWNANIPYTVSDVEEPGFMGWYFDANGENKVPATYRPTEDVTLYAKWSDTYLEFYLGDDETDPKIVYYMEGDKLGEIAPEVEDIILTPSEGFPYGKYFGGWVLENGDEALDLDYVLSSSDSSTEIYAKWLAVPAYYGSYYGTEIFAQSNVNYSVKNVTVEKDGTFTGSWGGTIKSYDPETQKIVYVGTNGNEYGAWYDHESGIFVLNDTQKSYMTNDIYIMSRYLTSANYRVNSGYGIQTAPPTDSSETSRGYYAHIVNMKVSATEDGDVLFYNGHIYVGVTITNTKNEELTIATIKNSKNVVIKDKDGNVVLAVASTGASFNAQSNTVELDSYYGSYTVGEKTVVLDGASGVTVTEGDSTVTGRYVLLSDNDGVVKFDVFVQESGVDTEHWVLTLSEAGNSFVKEMITITDGTTGKTYSVNTKIAIVPPTPTNDDASKIFRGWFTDEECKKELVLTDNKYTFTTDITLYSKWQQKVTLTVHYNNSIGTGAPEDEVIEYAAGEIAVMGNPASTAMKFAGWYTTPNFEPGSEWVSGEAINANTDIYAKWETPPPFFKTYSGTMGLNGTTANGSTTSYDNRSSVKIEMTPDGTAKTGTSYPFASGPISIENYNEDDGSLIFVYVSSRYRGFVDKDTGALIINQATGDNTDITNVWFFAPFTGVATSSNYSSSYWNSGKTRAIQFTSGGITYSYFIHNNAVYGGVKFMSAAVGGSSIAGKDCYNTEILVVLSSDNQVIAKFGYDGTTMQYLDGYEDITYTADTADGGVDLGNLTVDGVKNVTVGDKSGKYYLVDGVDYTADMYVEDDDTTVYYELTLDKDGSKYKAVKRMVTLNFVTEYDEENAVSGEVNKNIGIVLPELSDEIYVFLGWFIDEQCENMAALVDGKFVPVKDTTTLYAKWALKVSLTLNYGKNLPQRIIYFAKDSTVVLDDYLPDSTYIGGQLFTGWSRTENGELVDLTTITEDTELFAIWVDSPAFVLGGVGSETTQFSYDEATGIYTSNNKGRGSTTAIMSVTALTSGVLSFQYFSSGESSFDNLYITLNNPNISRGMTDGLLIRVQNENGLAAGQKPGDNGTVWLSHSVELNAGDVVYFGYTKDNSGDRGADTAWVRNIELLVIDMSVAGEYSCDGQPNVNLDGKGTITRGEETGSYVAVDGQENTYDVFFKDESGSPVSHYTMVVDPNERTYTLTPCTVEVTFNMNGHGSQLEAENVYTGVKYVLPTAETVTDDEWIFKGWYTEESCDGEPVTTVTPEDGNSYSYYAKWVKKYSLTVVYGNGLEQLVVYFGDGDEVNLNDYKPGYTDGKMFDGWYKDQAYSDPVSETLFNISENTTVYVKWMEGSTFTVECKGPNGTEKTFAPSGTDGEYLTNASNATENIYIAINIYADGTLKFKWKALDGDPDNDGVDCQMQYSVYTNGVQTSRPSRWTYVNSPAASGTFASLPWYDASIEVQAGTTVYIIFNRVWAASNAQAGIKDIIVE